MRSVAPHPKGFIQMLFSCSRALFCLNEITISRCRQHFAETRVEGTKGKQKLFHNRLGRFFNKIFADLMIAKLLRIQRRLQRPVCWGSLWK